jgi:hypothetical protein
MCPTVTGSAVWKKRSFQALWSMGLLLTKGVKFQTAAEAREAGGTSAYMVRFVKDSEDDGPRGGGGGTCGDVDVAAMRSFDAHLQQHHGGARSSLMVVIFRLVFQLMYRVIGVVDDIGISAMVSDIAMNVSNYPAAFAARWATCRRLVNTSSKLAAAKMWHSFKMDIVVHLYERVGGVVCERFAGYYAPTSCNPRVVVCIALGLCRAASTVFPALTVAACSDAEWKGFSTVAFQCDGSGGQKYCAAIKPDGLITVKGEGEGGLAVLIVEEKAGTVGHNDGKDMYVQVPRLSGECSIAGCSDCSMCWVGCAGPSSFPGASLLLPTSRWPGLTQWRRTS